MLSVLAAPGHTTSLVAAVFSRVSALAGGAELACSGPGWRHGACLLLRPGWRRGSGVPVGGGWRRGSGWGSRPGIGWLGSGWLGLWRWLSRVPCIRASTGALQHGRALRIRAGRARPDQLPIPGG